MIAQETVEDLSHALVTPRSESLAMVLPPAVTRASRLLGFDVNGQPIAATGSVPSMALTPFMATLVDDADAATACRTLGMPFYFATAHKNGADQAGVADGVWTKVTFGSKSIDTGGRFDVALSRFTPGVAGWTLIIARVAWSGMEDQAAIGVHLFKNGGFHGPAGAVILGASGGTGYQGGSFVAIAEHGAADYFEIFGLWDGAGGTRTINGAGSQTFAQFLTFRQTA